MRLVVDATMVKPGQAGIRTYARELVRALADREGLDVVVAVVKGLREDWGRARSIPTELERQDPAHRIAWRQQNIPRLLRRVQADALLVPAPEPVFRPRVPQAVVIHDVGPLVAPGVYGRRRFLEYLATIRRTVLSSDVVIAPSHSTRHDLVRWVGMVAARRIVVAGPRLDWTPVADSSGRAAGSRDSFALYAGALLPHKNVETVIRAYLDATPSMPRELVLVGPDYDGERSAVMRQVPSGAPVRDLGFVDSRTRDDLYASAACVVFPSLFEGFGLPVAEALAAGAPVIASDLTVLREVAGDHAAYISDPLAPDAWRRSLSALPPALSSRPNINWSEAAGSIHERLIGECA